MEEIKIETEFIKLEQLLKYVNIVSSGGIAKEIIQNGEVYVNGEVETRRGKKLRPGDKVQYEKDVYIIK
ncbi:S4 domain-containing protein YaaA [Lagierella massiliensis]|uniref:S4 domain-containing protein YaaA n=1 Tax=Lagierella massiliensis TaxID=1689303 RepID=UPI0006D79577|nr:S4 domain-containing protein YaaA [Lagierella massiliensis]